MEAETAVMVHLAALAVVVLVLGRLMVQAVLEIRQALHNLKEIVAQIAHLELILAVAVVAQVQQDQAKMEEMELHHLLRVLL
jgi:hypothetical protein